MAVKFITQPARRVEILRRVDVLVIGGSQSGVAAAVCARRANPGASVLLVEQNGFLGGQSVGGLVIHYEFREHTNNRGQVLAKGISKEIISRVVDKGHSDPLFKEWLEGKGPPFEGVPDGRAHGDVPLNDNDIKLVLVEMCEEAGVEVLLHTRAVDASDEVYSPAMTTTPPGSLPERVIFIETINGRYAVLSKMVVDCSGNADVAFWLGGPGAAIIPTRQVMSMQAYVWIEGVDLEEFVNAVWERKGWHVLYPDNKEQMMEHVRQGKVIITRGWMDIIDKAFEAEPNLIDAYDETGAVPQMYFWLKTVKTRKVEVGGRIKYLGTFAIEGPQFLDNQMDPFTVSRAELNQVKGAHIQARMHTYIPGWQHSKLDRTVSRIGFRQTRIPLGLYKLTKEDVLTHARFDDVVGRGSGHDIGRGKEDAEYGYDIPYRILVPEKIDGLLFGARCVSVEDDGADQMLTALNAHRGITTCMIVSQASGVAAALCLKLGVQPRDLDVKVLQDELRKQDVVLETPRDVE
ncbi:MAG: FAD-dependent oxidoreductase [Promethearchaeota archaeon]